MAGIKLRKPLVLSAALRVRYANRAERLAIRTKYAERLACCRKAWEATQDPAALAEAITWTFHYRQPIEPWIEEAVVQVLIQVRSPKVAKRHHENIEHFWRWHCVRDAHAQGMTFDEAKAATVDILAKLGRHVETGTIWGSYKKVQKDMRERRNGRYWNLKDKRYRHLESRWK
jgi:hypothetical protein